MSEQRDYSATHTTTARSITELEQALSEERWEDAVFILDRLLWLFKIIKTYAEEQKNEESNNAG